MISEIARFISTLLAAASVDTYILWNVQDASHVFFAVGFNLVLILGYCISYETRRDDVSRDRSRSIRDGLSSKTLTERKQVGVCGKALALPFFDHCVSSISLAGIVGLGVAGLLFAGLLYIKSQNRDCSIEEFDNPDYQYAVRTTGNCHTTAQRTTIEGAIDHFIDDEMPPNVCGVHCLELNHDGNWQGYVAFGAGTYDWEKYLDQCTSVEKLGHCGSGGKKYVNG